MEEYTTKIRLLPSGSSMVGRRAHLGGLGGRERCSRGGEQAQQWAACFRGGGKRGSRGSLPELGFPSCTLVATMLLPLPGSALPTVMLPSPSCTLLVTGVCSPSPSFLPTLFAPMSPPPCSCHLAHADAIVLASSPLCSHRRHRLRPDRLRPHRSIDRTWHRATTTRHSARCMPPPSQSVHAHPARVPKMVISRTYISQSAFKWDGSCFHSLSRSIYPKWRNSLITNLLALHQHPFLWTYDIYLVTLSLLHPLTF